MYLHKFCTQYKSRAYICYTCAGGARYGYKYCVQQYVCKITFMHGCIFDSDLLVEYDHWTVHTVVHVRARTIRIFTTPPPSPLPNPQT